jgi:uncharacterized protein (PEP-CTERM system associated)
MAVADRRRPPCSPRREVRLAPAERGRATKALLCSAILLALGLSGAPVAAQEAGAARTWAIEPRLGLEQTFTDNGSLTTTRESDAITEATVGVRLGLSGARVKGSFDYALAASAHARQKDENESRHQLNAAATAELVERSAFVDLNAGISEQRISAFGTLPPDETRGRDNRTRVMTLGLSPRVNGYLLGFADYSARLGHEITRTSSSAVSNSSTTSAQAGLQGGSSQLGWAGNVEHRISDYSEGRRTTDSSATVSVRTRFDLQYLLGASAGVERNNFDSARSESSATWGLEGSWLPSPRTSLRADYKHHDYGDEHGLQFDFRTPLSSWSISDRRGVVNGSSQGLAQLGSVYNILFQRFSSEDPTASQSDLDAKVRQVLQDQNISPDATLVSGFLASSLSVQRTQSVSVGFTGLRASAFIRLGRTVNRRIDSVTTAIDDLGTRSSVRQNVVAVELSYRLSPFSTVGASGSYQKSEGNADEETERRFAALNWAMALGTSANVAASVRRTVVNGGTTPYTENALVASYQQRF